MVYCISNPCNLTLGHGDPSTHPHADERGVSDLIPSFEFTVTVVDGLSFPHTLGLGQSGGVYFTSPRT